MTIIYTPLEAPDLIQSQDLLPYVYSTIQAASNGVINDFSEHSPIAALAEGLDFSARELRYWMNRVAAAMAINHLKIAGVMRRLGAKAAVTVTFTLTAPLSTPFLLSAGYMVSTETDLEFYTDVDLVIPPGSIAGSVTATARDPGIAYNVGPQAIARLSESRAFLKSVTNLVSATGGLDEETQEEVLSRGFAALRYRGVLITEDDFVQEAIRQLGTGAVVKAVGRLGADKISYEKGSVHLFVLNPDGTIPNQAQLTNLKNALQAQVPTFLQEQKAITIASALYADAIDLYAINIHVIASLIPGDNPDTRSAEIYAQLASYLKPGNLELGETVILKELENVVRQSGVRFVQSVTSIVDGGGTSYADIPLPNAWSAASLTGCTIELISTAGQKFTYSF